MAGYDYSQPGYYFVTVCTKEKRIYFGEIKNGEMELSPLGKVVDERWKAIPEHFENVELDVYQIMPNHIHGIIVIKDDKEGTTRALSLQESPQREREQEEGEEVGNDQRKGRRRMVLPTVVSQFKMESSREIHESGVGDFGWQRSFYDHVIRDDESLWSTRQYIVDNPMKWDLDRNNPVNVGSEYSDDF